MRRLSVLIAFFTWLLPLASPLHAQRKPACDQNNAGLTLPEGFCALLVADSLGSARHLVVAPNGDIIVNTQGRRGGGAGGVILLRDSNGDGKADVRQALGTPGGHGIALRSENLYLTTNDAVLRYRLPAGATSVAAGPDTLVMGLPAQPGHPTKAIVLGPSGTLFVHVGSASNVCETPGHRGIEPPGQNPCAELSTRAGVWQFRDDRLRQRQSDGTHYATGLRNLNALALNPENGVLYGVQHGRDRLFQNWARLGYTEQDGAENPSEVLVEIRQGDDHGWPYCYHDRFVGHLVLAPEYGGDRRSAGLCARKKQPLVGFPGHWAPNGVAFYTGSQFPASYRGGVFIAFHGSWNRAPLPQAGFNVVFQPMSGGKPSGDHAVFADGFQTLEPRGRPVGVAEGPDGSLYISDDSGGRIWRVIHR
jgi:glucose/arabinose dehydrogenase